MKNKDSYKEEPVPEIMYPLVAAVALSCVELAGVPYRLRIKWTNVLPES